MYNEKIIPVFIEAIHEETALVKRFTLKSMDGAILPSFSSGSHIITYIEGQNGMISRPYSLTNYSEKPDRYQIAIRLSDNSRGGSLYWHQHVKVGDNLYISFPKNHFPLSFKAKHHVFYAAGIGITPFLSMMTELQEQGASFELHYAAKTRESCAFYSNIKEKYGGQSYFYFSNDKRLMTNSLLNHMIGTHIYVCGPDSFITSFTGAANGIGYPKSSVHIERFTPTQIKMPSSFQVTLSSGEKVQVNKEQSLLDALLEAGKRIPYSCRVGRCGTCELKVLEGEVEHHDSFLSEEQRKSNHVILSCVSRAKADKLTLDFQ